MEFSEGSVYYHSVQRIKRDQITHSLIMYRSLKAPKVSVEETDFRFNSSRRL